MLIVLGAALTLPFCLSLLVLSAGEVDPSSGPSGGQR